jgi:hypothetical protein
VSGSRYATCQQCRDLLRSHSEAVEKFAALSRELINVAISYEADAFDRIWHRVKIAQLAASESRDAFQAHLLTHRSPLENA